MKNKTMRTGLQNKYLRINGYDTTKKSEDFSNIFTTKDYLDWESMTLAELGMPQVIKMPGVTSEEELNKGENQKMQEDTTAEQSSVNPAEQLPAEEVLQTEQTVAVQDEPIKAPKGFEALDSSGEIEKQKFDPTPYIGKDSFIEFIEERKGQFGYYIKLFTQVVDDSDWEIRASTIFGLEEDKNGRLGWPPGSKLYNFLAKHKVTHYRDLLSSPITKILTDDKGEEFRRITGGFKTQIKIQTRAKGEKEYLTFN